MDKYAIVLGGGGAKGVYQIGVWKALNEKNIKINAVIGTSIGAINGALMVQGNYDKAAEMWNNIKLNSVLNIPEDMMKNGKIMLTGDNLDLIVKLQKIMIKNKGIDTTPLRHMIETYINEEKIRNSNIDFGIVSYNVSNLKPIEVFKDHIPEGELYNYLMASSALPGLKQVRINGCVTADGGIHDNVPYDLAKRRGYNRIIVVDVSGIGRNRKPDVTGCQTIYIKNSSDLGSILETDRDLYKKNMELGYIDTMKVFGKYAGVTYTYIDDAGLKNKLQQYLTENEEYIIRNVTSVKGKKYSIRELLPQKYQLHRDLPGVIVECAAVVLKIQSDKLYKFSDLTGAVIEAYKILKNKKKKYEKSTGLDLVLKMIAEKRDVFHLSAAEYDIAAGFIFGDKNHDTAIGKNLSSVISELYGARIFFLMVEDGVFD